MRQAAIKNIAVSMVTMAILTACGGGGGGSLQSSAPVSAPKPVSKPVPTRVQPESVSTPSAPVPGRGVTTATGIDRIPLDAIKVTRREMAEMYAIIEFKGDSDYTIAHSPAGNRRTPHSDNVREVACHSYIEACDGPFGPNAPFQFHLGVRYPEGMPEQRVSEQIEMILRNLPDSVKIVSASFSGGWNTPAAILGAGLPFAAVQSAGNQLRVTFPEPNSRDNPALANIRAAIAADKLLLVAGYDTAAAERGEYRNSGTGCEGEGYSEGCIWAPFRISHWSGGAEMVVSMSGTSASAPHVASALASVLAVFPETTPQNLVRLAKACAIPTPSLPGGVGRADFTCMTVMDGSGEWRVVSSEEFAGLLISPNRMNAMVFPGDARVTGSFVGRSGRTVELGTSLRGVYGFSAGIPGNAMRETGFFPVLVADNGNPAVGGGYMSSDGMFLSAAMGDRDGFFGLGGYSGTRSVDAEIGHRNLYARFSRQWSSAPLIRAVRGDSMGLTAEYSFAVGETAVNLAGHMDRFAGGRADTVFGAVDINGSAWNHSLSLSVDHALSDASSLSFHADGHRSAHGDAMGAAVRYRLSF